MQQSAILSHNSENIKGGGGENVGKIPLNFLFRQSHRCIFIFKILSTIRSHADGNVRFFYLLGIKSWVFSLVRCRPFILQICVPANSAKRSHFIGLIVRYLSIINYLLCKMK